ncbi:hypothetical protein F0P96_13960 [Hymenobacter busanensis]|uniref:Uncharacterized protein n=1 Tax=Hymenobacter busanensis TaxID=2607656 RepID=A0A7L4ZZ04_9BACT|nr:carbohydrate binding domain-containing protein [Hymenobacter busanensis]KAA9331348.1 hypothetical protein F0P96_13960 [Hymenobacter busanensis]QHJ08501.1 hypothetical protein GUY19_14885 [Hymenobacter busanensis]
MKNAFLLLALVALVSCSKSDDQSANANAITATNFDDYEGWVPENASLTRERAHSGKFSIKVDGNSEFSMGYVNLLGKISPRKMRKLHLKAWAFLPSNKAAAKLGMQITDPSTGQEIFGDGIKLTDQVTSFNKWVEVEKDITLPDNIAPTQLLKLFLWRDSASEPAYIDDLSLTIVE